MLSPGTKIYITGRSGLVGHALLDEPRISACRVVSPTHRELDLLNERDVDSFIERERPDLVIHCAALVGGIQANIDSHFDFFTQNMRMAMNIISAVRARPDIRLVNYASSCAYPCAAPDPLKEEFLFTGPFEPTNEGYGMAKAAAVRLCAFADGARCKTLVPCNLYGRYDKFGEENSHMIPAAIRKLHEATASGADEVVIWGDGAARREFMYAGDLARMTADYLERFDDMPPVMNIGTGVDHTVDEYYKIAAEVIGYKGTFVHDLTKPVGMRHKRLDVSAQERFGIRPKFSLQDGIRSTYEHYISVVAVRGRAA